MEKENVNPQESNNFSKFGKSQVLMADESQYTSTVGMNISHNCSLEELFRGYVDCGIKAFKKDGEMMPAAFLVCRDYKEEKYKIIIIPMPNNGPGAMQIHSQILRRLCAEMKAAEQPTFKLVGVIIGMESLMSQYKKEEIFDGKGNIDKDKYVPPSQDKNAKEVLNFWLEDKFGKHILIYEFIKSADGSIVVNETPLIDEKQPYDEQTDKNSNFGFPFAEKMNQN